MKMDENFMMDDDMVIKPKSSKKMMTMEDVSEHLQKDFEEEINDAKKYLCMSKIADSAGDHYSCHYLLEIAKDEYTHAQFICDFMKRHDIHIPAEQKQHFEELEETMAKFFRT